MITGYDTQKKYKFTAGGQLISNLVGKKYLAEISVGAKTSSNALIRQRFLFIYNSFFLGKHHIVFTLVYGKVWVNIIVKK